MAETWFSNNYRDLCQSSGVGAGFQYEFYCQRCNDAFRTPFEPYKSAQAAGWLNQAAGRLGGIFGTADQAVNNLLDAGWAKARDASFQHAMQLAEGHFHRCSRCNSHVCDVCFDAQKGLCYNCAPNVQVEIEAARNAGELNMASEMARAEGESRAQQLDVKTDKQLVCPHCGAEAHGSKFCPECGQKLAVLNNCPSCNAEVAPGTKFCPECGTKIS